MKVLRHLVFWGSHECHKVRGHANPCLCWCGVPLPMGVVPFGEDSASAVNDPNTPFLEGNTDYDA